MRLWMFVASLLATHGSVIVKQDRISPSSSGARNSSCCSGVPNVARISMLPVSGAEQFVGLGRTAGSCPSARTAARTRRSTARARSASSGRNRFHRPRLLRLGLQVLHDRRMGVRVAGRLDLLAVRPAPPARRARR